MKIYENNVELDGGRVLLSNDPFELIKKLIDSNKNILLVTPLTKIKDIINFTKDGSLEKLINDYWQDENINFMKLNSLVGGVNEMVGGELVDFIQDKNKIFKALFELSDALIIKDNISRILEIVFQKNEKHPEIIIFGFKNKVEISLPHLQIVNSIKGNVNFANLEKLLIHGENKIFEVHDRDAFIAWLELQTKTVITEGALNKYLCGDEGFSSYVIDQVLKKLTF